MYTNNKHFSTHIPPPPNPYPHGQPQHTMIMNPYPNHSYPQTYPPPQTQSSNSYLISTNPPNPSLSSSKRTLPTCVPNHNAPPHKKPKMSAHELFAHRAMHGHGQGTDTSTPISVFHNPYSKNQRIQVCEGNIPMWLDGTIIDIGYDWIQVRYVGFSKNYDSTIFVDPSHCEFNKYKIRLLQNIKSENDNKNNGNNNGNNGMEMDCDMTLNNKLLLQQLEQLIIVKRKELNNKKYNLVINDINIFLNGFDIRNINKNKYNLISELYVIYAIGLGQKSEFNKAIKYCKKSINLSPKYYKSYTTLGLLYQFEEKYNLAMKNYKIALGLNMEKNKKRQIEQSLNKLLIIMKNSNKNGKKEVMSDSDSCNSDNEPINSNNNNNNNNKYKPIIKKPKCKNNSDSESDTQSENDPIVSKKDNSDSESDNEYVKAKGRGVKGTTLDERIMDTSLMSTIQKSAYENRVKNPNGFYYRFNEKGESQTNGGWNESEHKKFMKRTLEIGVNIEWGLFSRKIKGRVGYQCSNYWRALINDGYINDQNYINEKGKNGKMKRRQFRKKEILDNNNQTSDTYFDKFRRFQFTVLKDPSKTFKNTPCLHPKAPNGGNGIVRRNGRKKSKNKRRKKDKKKIKINKHKKRKTKRRKRRLSDSESDNLSMDISSEESDELSDNYDNKRRKKKKIKNERIKKEKKKKKGKKIKIEEPANEFLCPISYELMNDPVIVKSGWTYERSAIENWIKDNGNDPNTRESCNMNDLIPNRTLRDAIVRWKQSVGYVKTEKY